MVLLQSSGKKIITSKIILTTGTFLNGLIHVGDQQTPAGRYNEKPTTGLTNNYKNIILILED